MKPTWDNGCPFCSEDCPEHDGKRCRMMGMRPSAICEPAVREMAEAIRTLRLLSVGYLDLDEKNCGSIKMLVQSLRDVSTRAQRALEKLKE